MSDLILQFQHIHKSFFGVPVLKGIDLDVAEGEFLVLVGFSGTGKTTLAALLVRALSSNKALWKARGSSFCWRARTFS